MVVILIAEQRDGISINVNCIKTTLMSVNRELEFSVKNLASLRMPIFVTLGKICPANPTIDFNVFWVMFKEMTINLESFNL